MPALAVPWPVVNGVAHGIVAFLAEGGWDVATVQARMAQRVPPYMMPKRFVALASLPTAPNGKLDRKALLRKLDEGELATGAPLDLAPAAPPSGRTDTDAR